jgi:PmbA protein
MEASDMAQQSNQMKNVGAARTGAVFSDVKQELGGIAEYALEKLRAAGADGAELGISRGRTDEMNVDGGKFSLLRTTFNSALSIRALVGGRKGSAVTNSLERGEIDRAAAEAVGAAKTSEPDDAEYVAESIGEREFVLGAGACDLDLVYERVREFLDQSAERFPKIEISQMITRYTASDSLYANSNGSRAYTRAAHYGNSGMLCARDGDKVSSFNGFGYGAEDFRTPILARGEMYRVLAETERQIDTVPVSGKFVGRLLVSPDCLRDFLFSVLGACVYDAALIAGSSPWKSKLGEAVADSRVHLALDPLDGRVVCGARVTGDGHLTERQELVRSGVLTGFALSQYGAKKTGRPRAGNVSGNLIVGAGTRSFEELVAATGDGLLINRFSGGSPALSGEFSGVAKNSFLIRGGEVAHAVSETMVSGNLLDMLQNVVEIGGEAVADGGGAAPWIVFDCVTISGK